MKRILLSASSLLVIAAALGAATVSSQAADLSAAPVYTKAPVVEAWNPWMVRLRVLGVIPDASGSTVNAGGAPLQGAGLSISNVVVPELDISYFFTPNIAAEVILGVTRNSITGTGATTIAGLPIGKTWLLPPTVTLQYHFTGLGAFKPYIGAGVNYTVFFNQSAANTPFAAPLGNLTTTALSISNSFGGAVQFGADYMLDRHWGLNFDVKKLFLRPNYTATVSGLPVSGRANIDPWLVAGGITYKF